MSLETFIGTLRIHREQRSGPGFYASDKVFALLDELDRKSESGWIVGSGDGTKWRVWRHGLPDWTDRRDEATRFARREDAEAVHAEDEDAWTIIHFEGDTP